MRTHILARAGAACAVTILMLILVWLILPSTGRASSTSDGVEILASPPAHRQLSSSLPLTDTRWLALVRSSPPRRLTVQQATALPSINLHLTDGFVAGRVSTAATVVISVTRGQPGGLRDDHSVS